MDWLLSAIGHFALATWVIHTRQGTVGAASVVLADLRMPLIVAHYKLKL